MTATAPDLAKAREIADLSPNMSVEASAKLEARIATALAEARIEGMREILQRVATERDLEYGSLRRAEGYIRGRIAELSEGGTDVR